ncbi:MULTISPECIES: CynX/NimT family MFS transporter [unclassified Rathayibacter]|uniref:MFS transporter n=1 Tax=unclassified Rathayibacter TaxID=2609250 RepID=UPI001FB4A6EF|nr:MULTISPECIES: MFS transporter [unclassified Rathayibacter]MCJ1674778.1 MFS transporter [Rathayibacter sp. VKM Ac-2929]MCJ1683771.1 MFS transporter [Rathayibacter sp. VKM Ac-2928]
MTSTVVTPQRTALLALAAIVMTALNLRTAVTGFSPLLETIGADLGFGPSLYGAFGTIVTASFAVFGVVAAAAARRFGLERTLAVATLMTTAGLVLRALSPSPLALVLSSVVAFAGVGTSNVLIVPIVKRYFADRLKTISSLYLALLQTGQFVAPLVAVPLASALDWRFAVGVWAALTAVACLLWAALARRREAGTAAAAAPTRLAGAWRTRLLWAMVLMLGMTALNTYAIITWLPTILVDAGADPAQGGALLALFSIFGLGAAFVVPPLTLGMRNPSIVVVVCVALLAVGYVGLLVAPLAGAVAWVVCLGLGVSTFPMTLTLVNARTRSTAGSSVLSGATQGLGYALACAGPLLIGLLYEAQGSWTGSYVLLLASLVVLLLSGLAASRPRFLEDEAAAR